MVIKRYLNEEHNNSFNVAPSINLSVNDIAIIALKTCNAEYMTMKYDSSKPNGQHRKEVMPDMDFLDLASRVKTIYDIAVSEMLSFMDKQAKYVVKISAEESQKDAVVHRAKGEFVRGYSGFRTSQ